MVAFQAVGIAFAVEAFVVMAGDFGHFGEGCDVVQDVGGMHGVGFDGGEFRVGQLVWLVENGVGDGQFADVVQQGGAAQEAAVIDSEVQFFGDEVGVKCHAFGMAAGEGAF